MGIHTATFVRTDGDWLEAEIEIDGVRLVVMDEFGGELLKPGQPVQVTFSAISDDNEEETWDKIFAGNPDQKRCLEQQLGWAYIAFGRIDSVAPVICDCGLMKIDGPVDTHDERCVGEFVRFSISRLSAHRA